MSGLLKKASSSRFRDPDSFDLDAIPRSEKDKIFEEIDQAIALGKIPISDSTFRFQAAKDDKKLPFLFNIAALILIAVLGSFMYFYFGSAEETIVSASENLNLTESQLIEALKAESLEKLSIKEQEILRIESEMNEIVEEQTLLLMASQKEIKRLETALKENISREMISEEEKLRGQGLDAEQLNERLQALQNRMEERYVTERAALISEIEKEKLLKEAELNLMIREYEISLEEARREQNLAEGRRSREIEEIQSLFQSENENALLQYQALVDFNEKELFVLNQISDRYGDVTAAIGASDREEALEKINYLEDFLQNDEISAYPAVAARKDTDQIILQSLKNLIEPGETEKADGSIELSRLLDGIIEDAEVSTAQYKAGNFDRARDSYMKALSRIPPLEQGYSNLQELVLQEQEELRSRYETALQESIVITEEELSLLNQARDNVVISEEELDLLNRAGESVLVSDEDYNLLKDAKIRSAERQKLLALLDGLVDESVLIEPAGINEEEDLLELLSIKVLIKEVLASKTVRKDFPDLHNQLESYLEAYGELRESSGRTVILNEIINLMKKLEVGEIYYPSSPMDKSQTESYRLFLTHLQQIIEKTD